jgi:hypothetical protein
MEKKKKLKIRNLIIKEVTQPHVEKIILEEMYAWEKHYLSVKGKKNSLIGYG